MNANELLKYDLDEIPKYLLLRDVIGTNSNDQELIELKKRILNNEFVKKIVNQQWDDGSWGLFHSMSTSSKSSMTTEIALRRLLHLGLDKNDEPIKKAVRYMELYLREEINLRDYKEKKHDWRLLTRLFVSVWLRKINEDNELANKEARKWAEVITHAFSNGVFNEADYINAYKEILKPEEGKTIWGIQNFYIISLLPGLLKADSESSFLDYILNEEKGIGYIYNGRLLSIPQEFKSRQANRYLYAYDLIFDYTSAIQKPQVFFNWIMKQKAEDGFWDMDKIVKDNMQFPLSNSWRKPINRKIDCTVRILKILKKLENSYKNNILMGCSYGS